MSVRYADMVTNTGMKAAKTGTLHRPVRNAVHQKRNGSFHRFPSTGCNPSAVEQLVAERVIPVRVDADRPAPAVGKANMETENKTTEKNAEAFQEWMRRHMPQEVGFTGAEATDSWNIGAIEGADGYGMICGICGDSMEVWLRINGGVISEARFLTDGCLSSQLCGSAATFLAKGETLMDALRISPASIMDLMSGLQGVELHCSILATSTLFRAIADHILKTNGETIHKG
jgi:nitrogen fixation protein NifU and related proteins